MNQRIHNLSKWRFLREGRGIHYPGRAQRTVIVEVNCPSEVAFYVAQDPIDIEADPERQSDQEAGRRSFHDDVSDREDDEHRSLTFIGLCKGRDRLEFAVDGSFDLIVEGGSAYVFSNDGQAIATEIVAPIIFTRIANRRQRNPHLEMMEYRMRLNQERMQEELVGEIQRRLEAAEGERYVAQRDYRAPDGLVGRPEGRDSVASGETEVDAGSDGSAPDEGDEGGSVPAKRRRVKEAIDV